MLFVWMRNGGMSDVTSEEGNSEKAKEHKSEREKENEKELWERGEALSLRCIHSAAKNKGDRGRMLSHHDYAWGLMPPGTMNCGAEGRRREAGWNIERQVGR